MQGNVENCLFMNPYAEHSLFVYASSPISSY